MKTEYDKSILDGYFNQNIWFTHEFIGLISGGKKIWYRIIDEEEIVPHKYKIVNWWRKITKTEVYRQKLERSEVNPWTGKEEYYTSPEPFYNSKIMYKAPK